MKVKVTHLKAPWPAGAIIGAVIEVEGDAMPDSLVGKCLAYDGDEPAVGVYAPPPPPVIVAETKLAGPAEAAERAELVEELERAKALLQISEQEAGELRQRVETAEAKAAQLGAQLQGLQEQLDAALAAKAAEASAKTPAKASK